MSAMNSDSDGKVKPVVSELVINWRKLNSTECNIKLFTSLLNKNISTRDIHFFVQKQADLRKVHKGLDKPMTRAAMRAKLNDACAFSVRQRRVVEKLKKKLFAATGNKRFKQRKIIKQVRLMLEKEKKTHLSRDEEKVKRYTLIQSQIDQDPQTKKLDLPASLKDFSTLKAFLPEVSQPQKIEPPKIYDESISLSNDERSLLAKGPKFAVRQKLLKESFKIELEKMVCKKKYRSDEPPDPDSTGPSRPSEVNHDLPTTDLQTQNHPSGKSFNGFVASNQSPEPIIGQTKYDLNQDWAERRSQLVFDFCEGSVDPGRLRATDYKFNRSTNLPKPSSAELEAKHELRKMESLKIFNKAVSTNSKSSSNTPLPCRSNLSPGELRGLKSLQKRVASGEIVICESDKSARLCVLSRNQYIESGNAHCKKDLEISLTDVKRLQKHVNAHVEWLHEILGTGSFWGHEDRIRTSSLDLGCQAAPLRLLLKDHKPWNPVSGKEIPSRPVVNAKAGYNCHLSEVLSLILGPVAKEAAGCEFNSTGDLLSKINDINERSLLLKSSNVSVDPDDSQTKSSIMSPSVSIDCSPSQAKSPVSSSQRECSKLEDDCRSIKQTQHSANTCSAESFVNVEDGWCDHCQKCNHTVPTLVEMNQAKDLIQRVTSKKVNSAMHVTHNLRSKLKASRAATKLYHRCCLKPPQDPVTMSPERPIPQDQVSLTMLLRPIFQTLFPNQVVLVVRMQLILLICHQLPATLLLMEMSIVVK